MESLHIIILGIVQGLTEFLPVSSSGHLILAPIVFDFEDQGLALDAILHLATLLAIIIFFRADLLKLLQGIFSSGGDPAYRRLAWSIVLATFPAGLIGLFWADEIEFYLRNPTFVACNLIFWSIVFYFADRKSAKNENTIDQCEQMTLGQVFFVGCAQAIALLPGTSRSGVTIAAGLFNHLSQEAAARFSFLLGTPIILAAGLHKSVSTLSMPDRHILYSNTQLAVGFLVTFVIGYLSIKLLLKIVGKYGLFPFIIYRIVLATIILIFFT
ncbi:MAG: undecaprenyl-diphosphate phosphatase [Nitrospinales bacterium]